MSILVVSPKGKKKTGMGGWRLREVILTMYLSFTQRGRARGIGSSSSMCSANYVFIGLGH